ncbi:hypothetical protein [Pseudomonas sp.]|uniref:hypothetical protein n=1 Tax=Pseudomonas sp. TaxID=306 RepID=UPI00258506ED|nr:hypothetical protein [Pseudomonas sp.]
MSREKEKGATTDYRALDVRELHRTGVLVAGWNGSWRWSRQGKVVASIDLAVESLERVRLSYRLTRDGQAEEKDYPVPITWTPCHLGGSRPWFLCPCCGRRVAKLYISTLFACRGCLRLNYRSQQASKRDRPIDRSFDLRRALGCDEGFLIRPAELIRKPKGMHWRTFERKVEQLKEVDARALADAAAMLGIIERKVNRARASLPVR